MKRILSIALCVLFMLVAVACSSTTDTPTPTPATSAATATEAPTEMVYTDSPFLKDRGLPPVADRLPKVPKLPNTVPLEDLNPSIGKYGGVIRTITHEGGFDAMAFCMNNVPVLNSPGLLGTEITGNVFESWEVNDEQTVFTFKMREGLRWSDGEPVTMEDVKFAFEDLLYNEAFTPTAPTWLRAGSASDGTPGAFKVIDDWRFSITFDKPYGGFPFMISISGWIGYTDLIKPKHFLSKYHPTYSSEADIDALAKEKNYEFVREENRWVDLFMLVDTLNWSNVDQKSIGFPSLQPYIMVEYQSDTQIKKFERNPYYFWVDSTGQQLPYIDTLVSYNVSDLEMLGMKVIAGEVDHSCEHIETSKLAFYLENAERGGYKIYMPYLHRTGADIFLNQTVNVPELREAFTNVKFREALNLAIDKKDIIETIYLNLAEPFAPQYDGKEYNIEKAGQILDEIGMTKDASGFRTTKDGKKIDILYEASPDRADTLPISELVSMGWQELGISNQLKQISGDLRSKRMGANELQCTTGWTSGPVMWTFLDFNESAWCYNWNLWYTSKGASGEEPPENMKEYFKDRDQIMAASLDEGHKAWQRNMDRIADEYLYFILADKIKSPSAINAKLQNYTDKGFGIAQFFGPEIWWYAD